MGRKLFTLDNDSVLWIGIILDRLSRSWNIPAVKDRLKIFDSGAEIISLDFWTTDVGILSTPQELLFFKFDIIEIISSGVHGWAMKVSWTGFLRKFL